MQNMDTIKILLAEDHAVMREGIRSLIEKERPDWEVVGEAGTGETAVQLATRLLPDTILMDISMPGLNGIEATRQITSENPAVKVIALSMHSDRHHVLEMFKAGASGYVLKDDAFEEVMHAIQTVVANKTYLSARLNVATAKDCVRLFIENKFSRS